MLYRSIFFLSLLLIVFACSSSKEIIRYTNLEAAISQPTIFAPNLISTDLYERDLAISPDGKEIIFSRGDYKQFLRCLFRIEKTEKGWTTPRLLSFSGSYNDIEPFFSPDGQQLFFASKRPVDSSDKTADYNIWVVEKTGQHWGVPTLLNSNVNTEGDEFFPAVCKNGNLYFTASRKDAPGREDIFVSEFIDGSYQVARPLSNSINTALYEFNAFVSPDEDLIIFTSYGREDDLGGGDLYYSKKDENGNWQPAKNMGNLINSEKLDYCPFLDVSKGIFYFTSERFDPFPKRINSAEELNNQSRKIKNGLGNIYFVKWDALSLDKL